MHNRCTELINLLSCCAVLCCAVLCCAVLRCDVLCCAALPDCSNAVLIDELHSENIRPSKVRLSCLGCSFVSIEPLRAPMLY